MVKLPRRSNKDAPARAQGTSRLRIFHRKKVGKRDPRYLIKCGCCEQRLEIYYGDGTLEINGVMGSVEDWREVLFPLFGKPLDSEYANSETDFALSLEPWEHWLGMEVDPATLEGYTKPEVAAHCIWEMTFHGLEQSQIQETREELRRRVDELNAMTEEERKEKLIPMEQLMRNLDERMRRS